MLIDGRAEAALVRAEVATAVAALEAVGVRPGLRVILVGEHPASAAYVATKERMAREVGIDAATVRLGTDIAERELLSVISKLNGDPKVHGILVQLPLPAHIRASAVLEAVDQAKDVDGFHPLNAGRLATANGRPPADLLVPCTPRACMKLLERTLGASGLGGRRALVLGRSTIVGRPLAQLLLAADCTVTIAHSRTRDLAEECRRAEILITAVGTPGLVRGDWIGRGAVVLDVGISRIEREGGTRLVGDVVLEEAMGRAAAITPVPGGVGPMTVACLLENTVIAARAGLRRS